MTEVLQNIRFKTLLLDICFVVLGCILAIILSSRLLINISSFYDFNFVLFFISIIFYVFFCSYLHYKYRYLKLKKFKEALKIMYNTDETYIKIGTKKDNYGFFSKDKIGFIYYNKI